MIDVARLPIGVDLGPAGQADVRTYVAQVQAGRVRYGWKDKGDFQGDQAARVAQDLDAFGAEKAGSMATCLPWRRTLLLPGYTRPRPPDLGNRTEVRQTAHPDGSAEVKDDDPPDRIVLLVVGRFPSYLVVGWILAADAAACGWRMRGRGSLYVPQRFLLPIDTIPEDA